jgi:hypothetical protein
MCAEPDTPAGRETDTRLWSPFSERRRKTISAVREGLEERAVMVTPIRQSVFGVGRGYGNLR